MSTAAYTYIFLGLWSALCHCMDSVSHPLETVASQTSQITVLGHKTFSGIPYNLFNFSGNETAMEMSYWLEKFHFVSMYEHTL